jgi:small subunit ribosomal protein S9
MVKKFSHASGKRKRAIARATIKKGDGAVRLNGKPIDLFFPEVHRLKMQEPLILIGSKAKGLDIKVNIRGGGISSRAEASRLAISRALINYFEDEEIKKTFLDYDRNLLVADTRRKETRKPMRHSKARARRQMSKR